MKLLKKALTTKERPHLCQRILETPAKEYLEKGIEHHIHAERARFFSDALFFLHCNNFFGNYFEFGTFTAWTFRQVLLVAKQLGMMEKMRFYGFDSFEGFPVIDATDYSGAYGGFKDEAGTRAMSEDDFLWLVGKDFHEALDRVRTIKGFYGESLNEETAGKISGRASLVNVDCDLYESAVPVFQFIEGFIDQGSVIYIDDYWVGYKGSPTEGVAKAFAEYRGSSKFDFADWGRVGGWGHAFVAQVK